MIHLIINSSMVRLGNFGTRAKHIVKALESKNIYHFCVAREGIRGSENHKDLPIFSFFARGLNFIRTRYIPWWNNRFIERVFFEQIIKRHYRNITMKNHIVHLWEPSPNLIDFFHNKGAYVILEIPSVPMNFVKELKDTGKGDGLQYFERQARIEELAIIKADQIISPSKFVTGFIEKISSNSQVHTIPFGFPKARNVPVESNKNSKLMALYAGNIDYRKGFPELIEVMKVLKSDDIHLIIVGKKGKAFFDYKKEIPSNISVLGFQDLKKLYINSDVFLFPTWCEGSAKVTYEALANGCPVITTEYAGSLVEDNISGFILPPDDVMNWVEKLRMLIANREKLIELQKHAIQTSTSRSWTTYSEEVLEVYRSLK